MKSLRVSHVPFPFGMGMAGAIVSLTLVAPSVAAAPIMPTHLEPTAMAVEAADACLDDEEVAFLGLINDRRAASGLRPLSVSASLSAAAAYHSIDMAENGYLDHTMPDGTTVQQNMANFGYEGGAYGENLAAGTDTAAEAMGIWQNSPDHDANMLGSQFGAIGIGRAYDAASENGWYWTTIFGDVSDGPGWLCGQAAPASKSVQLFQSVDGATAASDINLRSGPADTYDLVTTLPPGTQMVVTGREQQSYVPVNVDGQFGWVGAEWIERGPISLEQAAAPGNSLEPGTASTIGAVEMYSAPSADGGIIATIPDVSVVTLTGEAQDGFLGVQFDGQQGWANASYLQVADISSPAMQLQAAPMPQASDNSAENAPASPSGVIGASAETISDVNLRDQPSANAMVLRVIPAGSAVTLTGSRANGYANVRINGQAGWIDENFLQ